MNIPQLGILEEIPVREAWESEPYSFTPWLAQHLDTLARVVGMPLEFEGREVKVEEFYADILARNPQDDSLVLIENQLEKADHNHLGQIMTYLAGLETRVVIWIAPDFRDAHLSAIRWLNDHTDGQFAFFAIKIKVVRIGDSEPAPVFEVLVKPNQWERQLHAVVKESQSSSDLFQFRKDFWAHYENRYPDSAGDAAAGSNSNRWRAVEDLDLKISRYIGSNSVGVFVRGGWGAKGNDVYELLAPHVEYLEEQTGAELGSPDGKHFFGVEYPADTRDPGRWDELVDWLYETTVKYEAALQAIAE